MSKSRLRQVTAQAKRHTAFYREKLNGHTRLTDESDFPSIPPTTLGELQDWISSKSDPLSGRARQSTQPAILIQAEPWDEEYPMYIQLTRHDLNRLARILAALWRAAGIGGGTRIQLNDFGTALSTIVASRAFAPFLDAGASELTGAVPICTDGLSELAARSTYVYSVFRPDFLSIRSNLVAVFLSNLDAVDRVHFLNELRGLLLVHSDGSPFLMRSTVRSPDSVLCRSDLGLFICSIKPCGGICCSDRDYFVEVVSEDGTPIIAPNEEGRLAVTALFSEGYFVIRYMTRIGAFLSHEVCTCGMRHKIKSTEIPRRVSRL